MNISELKNEEALDVLADLLDPTVSILGDADVKKLFSEHDNLKTAKHIIKNHKSEIIEILAICEGVKPEEYECNILTLPMKILEFLNNKEIIDFFSQFASVETEQTSFGAVTETTKGKE